jgi:hypothetical protein
MGHLLLKSTPAQINGSSGQRLFSSTTNITQSSGSIDSLGMATVPDGSSESLYCMTGALNATAGIDCIMSSATRTGRLALMVYLDDFLDSGNAPNTAASNFHQVQATIIISTGAAATSSYKHVVMLKRGWNHVILSRPHRDAPTRNGSATIAPTVGGVGCHAHINGDAAVFTSSMYDAAITRIRIQVPGMGATIKTRVFIKEIVDNARYDSRTCFIFDDGYASTYNTAFPIMRDLGLVGVVPVVSEFVGDAGYMTWAQLRELRDAGWDIVNHSKSHLSAATMAGYTYEQCLEEIETCRSAIIAEGCNVNNSADYYVAPFGGFQRMDAVNYRLALEDADVYASFGTTNRCTGPHLLDNHYIPRMDFNTTNTVVGYGIAELLRQYESAVRCGASPMLMLHDVLDSVPTPDSVKLLTSEFRQLCEVAFRLQQSGFTRVCGVTSAIPAMLTTTRGMA